MEDHGELFMGRSLERWFIWGMTVIIFTLTAITSFLSVHWIFGLIAIIFGIIGGIGLYPYNDHNEQSEKRV